MYNRDLQAAITRMQYVRLRVTHKFIELIALGLEDRLVLSCKDYIGGINAGPCALNIMDILFGDCLMYNNTFGSFMLYYKITGLIWQKPLLYENCDVNEEWSPAGMRESVLQVTLLWGVQHLLSPGPASRNVSVMSTWINAALWHFHMSKRKEFFRALSWTLQIGILISHIYICQTQRCRIMYVSLQWRSVPCTNNYLTRVSREVRSLLYNISHEIVSFIGLQR